MKRFTVSRNDDVKVYAWNGRNVIAVTNDNFSTIGECIEWATEAANGKNLTEIEIVNFTKDACASYNVHGKKI